MDIKSNCTGVQHLGIPTKDIQKSKSFYEGLGFKTVWETFNKQNAGMVSFLQLGNLVLEIYENKEVAMQSGAIDHIALDVTDIDSVFSKIKEAGHYRMVDAEVQYLPFWEHGVRFFTIIGPNEEKIEFCEMLTADK